MRYFIRLISFIPGKTLAKFSPHKKSFLVEYGKFIGRISNSFELFQHPAAYRDFHWDLQHSSSEIEKYIIHITDNKQKSIIQYFQKQYDEKVNPILSKVRKSVIHNDANDYNIIVHQIVAETWEFGLIDFGDMVYSHTVFELAIAIAYAILNKPDPLLAALNIVKGYNSVLSLTNEELEILFILIAMRLSQSVCISAYQKTLEPQNAYLTISEAPAWECLEKLQSINPIFAYYAFRWTCGMEPFPKGMLLKEWLQSNSELFHPIVNHKFQENDHIIFDFSIGSTEFPHFNDLLSSETLSKLIINKMKEKNVNLGVGKYNEARLQYLKPEFEFQGNERTEYRTIHLGIDIFCAKGTPIYSPLDGNIHSIANNTESFDYGPTIIVKHLIDDINVSFYILYGHLTEKSLEGLYPGKSIQKGEILGEIGDLKVNGGRPPHLHFQLIGDLFDYSGTYPGIIYEEYRDIWLSICPNPNIILQIPDNFLSSSDRSKQSILQRREKLIGKSLSIAYSDHLWMERGFMQFLFDQTGRKYLDGVNNVPHVGHSNPRVVKVLHNQAAVLNTNTRYVHEKIVEYADELLSHFPEPLSVCYFVNSGSEANELALRLAHTYTKANNVIILDGAYHGNTQRLIDISPYKHNGPGGEGAPSHVHTVTMPDMYRGSFKSSDPTVGEKYAQEITQILNGLRLRNEKIMAFMSESLLGCGGQIVLPDNYLKQVYGIIRESGGVCIADEVQVGFGRVGVKFWGYETQDVIPDIVTLGKPIGNGHPLGAVITTSKISESFNTGMEYFSTFGGNPVSCTVGLEVLKIITEENLQKNALNVGNYLKTRLTTLMNEYSVIGDVRGLGLFLGIELVLDRTTLDPAPNIASYIVERMKDKGVLLSIDGPLHNVIKIKPPIIFTETDADFLISCLISVLKEDFANPERK
jgi:4-aminobutyrate aminotransferase-like enzyme/Ser/Thr protein kinase RdoA (MazF antagonist)